MQLLTCEATLSVLSDWTADSPANALQLPVTVQLLIRPRQFLIPPPLLPLMTQLTMWPQHSAAPGPTLLVITQFATGPLEPNIPPPSGKSLVVSVEFPVMTQFLIVGPGPGINGG
jgi:hypothetical protein